MASVTSCIEIRAGCAVVWLLGMLAHLLPPAQTSRPQFPPKRGWAASSTGEACRQRWRASVRSAAQRSTRSAAKGCAPPHSLEGSAAHNRDGGVQKQTTTSAGRPMAEPLAPRIEARRAETAGRLGSTDLGREQSSRGVPRIRYVLQNMPLRPGPPGLNSRPLSPIPEYAHFFQVFLTIYDGATAPDLRGAG